MKCWRYSNKSSRGADGEIFPIKASLSQAEAGGQAIYTLILRDIEERKKAEAEMGKPRGLTRYLAEELRAAQEGEELIGASGGLSEVMSQVRQVAGTDATVLIIGETGRFEVADGGTLFLDEIGELPLKPCRRYPAATRRSPHRYAILTCHVVMP